MSHSAADPKRRLVVYAVSGPVLYEKMVVNSVRSLRAFNDSIPVCCVVFSSDRADAGDLLSSAPGLEVVAAPPLAGGAGGAFFAKWQALEYVPDVDEVLFLDADTVLFDDVERFFEQDADFVAREETRCGRGGDVVDWAAMDRIGRASGYDIWPVFNTGVMLFRSGFHREVAAMLDRFVSVALNFVTKPAEYPCSNTHISEEVCAAIVLGASGARRSAFYDAREVMFRSEFAMVPIGSAPSAPLLHTFTGYYWECIGRICAERLLPAGTLAQLITS